MPFQVLPNYLPWNTSISGTFINGVTGISVSGSNFITGGIYISGIGGLNIYQSGTNYILFSGGANSSIDHSDGINLSGTIYSTGSNLYNYINNFSGVFNNSGIQHQNQINSLSGFVKNTSISVTGFSPVFTGLIGLSGIGNVTVFTGINNTIIISGSSISSATDHGDGINLSGQLYQTGNILYRDIIGLSGIVDAINHTGITISGGILIALCAAYTPTVTGADFAEIPVPYSPYDGTTSMTFNVNRINLRVSTAGGTPSCNIQKSTGIGIFTPIHVGQLIMPNGGYETGIVTGLGTVQSNDKLRFSVIDLGSAQYWNITTELGI